MELFLKKNLVTGNTLSPDGVMAYTALRKLMSENSSLSKRESVEDCVSLNRLAYALVGARETYDVSLTDALAKGIQELDGVEILSVIHQIGSDYILDFTHLYLDTQMERFIMVSSDEVRSILICEEQMRKKSSLLKYYIALVGTFDWSKSMGERKGKVGHMSIEFIASQADLSGRTAMRYNDVLIAKRLIFIYKSNDKIRIDDRLKQIKNCYSRYEDKDICIGYASEFENMCGYEHHVVKTRKTKEQADNARRLAQIYNRICGGYTDYDKSTIRKVYKYIINKNKTLNEQYEEQILLGYTGENLLDQMKDESIFEQFDFLNSNSQNGNSDEWGEPDSIEDYMNMFDYSESEGDDL